MGAPVAQETRDLFQAASILPAGRSVWFDGGRTWRIPQPTFFGVRARFDRLQKFGALILNGESICGAARKSEVCRHTAKVFFARSGLPYTYKRPRHYSHARAMELCEQRSRRIARDVFLRDFCNWSDAASGRARRRAGKPFATMAGSEPNEARPDIVTVPDTVHTVRDFLTYMRSGKSRTSAPGSKSTPLNR